MINNNRSHVIGVIPTNTAELIPIRNSKNEASEVYASVLTASTTQTVYTVPSGKIFRWQYFMFWGSYHNTDHASIVIFDSTPTLKGQVYDYVAQGTESDTKIHSFSQFPVLSAGDYISVTIAATINSYSLMIQGYLEDA